MNEAAFEGCVSRYCCFGGSLFPSRFPATLLFGIYQFLFTPFSFPSERGYHSIVSLTSCYHKSEVTLCHVVVEKEELSNWFCLKKKNMMASSLHGSLTSHKYPRAICPLTSCENQVRVPTLVSTFHQNAQLIASNN